MEAYEQKHYKINPPDPVEAIKFRMEQLGLKPSDLAKILGGRSRVSEVLNKKRKLTVEMMRSLHKHLAIPAECLYFKAEQCYEDLINRVAVDYIREISAKIIPRVKVAKCRVHLNIQ